MIIQCKSCGEKQGTPVASSGCMAFGLATFMTGIICGALTRFMAQWAITLLAFPLFLLLCYVLWEAPRGWTTLRYHRKRCPHCGQCNWDTPHYSGFGL